MSSEKENTDEINTDISHEMGRLTPGAEDDFEMELMEDGGGLGCFNLKVDKFNRFSEFDPRAKIYVILIKGKQGTTVQCGSLGDLKNAGYLSWGEQNGNLKGMVARGLIKGVPNSAHVQFVSLSGRKLYQWTHKEKRMTDPEKPTGGSGRGRGKFIGHTEADEDIETIMFVNFEINDGEIVVEWNRRVDYNRFNDREKMLVSQYVMAEALNYIILRHLDPSGGIEVNINVEDKSSLSIIKQYLIYLDKDALNIFRGGQEKTPESDDFIDWKKNMLSLHCEKGKVLQILDNFEESSSDI